MRITKSLIGSSCLPNRAVQFSLVNPPNVPADSFQVSWTWSDSTFTPQRTGLNQPRIFQQTDTVQVTANVTVIVNGNPVNCPAVTTYDTILPAPNPCIAIQGGNDTACGPGFTVTYCDTCSQGIQRRWWSTNQTLTNDSTPGSVFCITDTMTAAGPVNITLRVRNINGCEATVSNNNALVVRDSLDVSFSSQVLNTCFGEAQADFTATVNLNGATNPQYLWSFQNGSPSTYNGLTPPTIDFNNTGPKSARLEVVTAGNCRDTFVLDTAITVVPRPNINLSAIPARDRGCLRNRAGDPDTLVVIAQLPNPGTSTVSSQVTVQPPGALRGVGGNNVDTFRFAPNQVGSHQVFMSYTQDGCTVRDSVTVEGLGLNNLRLVPTPDSRRAACDIPGNQTPPDPDSIGYFQVVIDTPYVAPDTLQLIVNDTASFNTNTNPAGPFSSPDNNWLITNYNPVDSFPVPLDDFDGWCAAVRYVTRDGCVDTVFSPCPMFLVGDPDPTYRVNDSLTGTVTACVGGDIELERELAPNDPNLLSQWTITCQPPCGVPPLIRNGGTLNFSLPEPGVYDIEHLTFLAPPNDTCRDSTISPGRVEIFGIAGNIPPPSAASGCPPLNSTFQFLDNPAVTRPALVNATYNWDVNPTAGVTIASPNAASTSIQFTSNGIYTIEVEVTNNNPAGDSCTNNFTYPNTVNVGIGADIQSNARRLPGTGGDPDTFDVCARDPVNIQSLFNINQPDPGTIQWTFDSCSGVGGIPVFINPTGPSTPNIDIRRVDPGTCKLILEGSFQNCSARDSVILRFNKPQASFSVFDSVLECSGQLTMDAQPAGMQDYTWIFNPVNGVGPCAVPDTQTITNPRYSQLWDTCRVTHDVTLIVQDQNGCRDTVSRPNAISLLGPLLYYDTDTSVGCDSVCVTFYDSSIVNTDSITFFPGDGSNQLRITPGDTIEHCFRLPVIGLNDNDSVYPYFPQIFALDNNIGCPTFYPDLSRGDTLDSVSIVRAPEISFAFAPDSADSIGCTPLTIQLQDSMLFANGFYWDFDSDGTADDSTNRNPSWTYTTPGRYPITLYAWSAPGCTTSVSGDTLTANALPLPNPQIGASDTLVCGGVDTITFTDLSTPAEAPILQRLWDLGDNSAPRSQPTISHLYTDEGQYTVSLIVTDTNGCQDTARQEIRIDQPFPSFTSDPVVGGTVFFPDLFIDFTNTSNNIGRATWIRTNTIDEVSGNVFSNDINPRLDLDESDAGQDIWIRLIHETQLGCVDSITQGPYNVRLPEFTLPNVFSPNGDGINDFYEVGYAGDSTFSFIVFDRWGDQVFSADDGTFRWDGRTNSGEEAQQGIYFYEMRIGAASVRGSFMLLR